MNCFPDTLHLTDGGLSGSSRLFVLESPFRFFSSLGLITVPAGFVTDGSSFPRFTWGLMSPFDECFKAAVIHDWLYTSANTRFNRKESDLLYDEGNRCLGVSWLKRQTIYSALRLFGGTFFKGKQ